MCVKARQKLNTIKIKSNLSLKTDNSIMLLAWDFKQYMNNWV